MLSVAYAECHMSALYAECRYARCRGAHIKRLWHYLLIGVISYRVFL